MRACGPSALTSALPIVQFQQFLYHHVNLKLGIAVHSGPVVAGVIGEQKFSHDPMGKYRECRRQDGI
jgi:class 3 adenylate cyclase